MVIAYAALFLALAQETAPATAKPAPVQRSAPWANQAEAVQVVGGFDLPAPTPTTPLPTTAELSRVDVPVELVKIARLFDAETFAERASALEQMSARKPSPRELMALLLRTDLSVEARNAIVSVLSDRIFNEPRGALGVRMEGPIVRESGVRVTGLVPGMPAERVLQVGDFIREVDGKPLVDRAELIRAVQALPPGVEVGLIVRRVKRDAAGRVLVGADGVEVTEDLKVKLRLGSVDDLDERGGARGAPVANAVLQDRQAQVEEARKRFLPLPRTVLFPARDGANRQYSLNAASLRKQLAAMKLAGTNPQLVDRLRERLDAVAARLVEGASEAESAAAQADLEALAIEIRRARGS